jgi:hypothetical protein
MDIRPIQTSEDHAAALRRIKEINLHQSQKIAAGWKVPAALLIQPYELDRLVQSDGFVVAAQGSPASAGEEAERKLKLTKRPKGA